MYTHTNAYTYLHIRHRVLTMITAATISEIQQVEISTPSKKNGVHYFTDELYPYGTEITAFIKTTTNIFLYTTKRDWIKN